MSKIQEIKHLFTEVRQIVSRYLRELARLRKERQNIIDEAVREVEEKKIAAVKNSITKL